jgi:hypothetical protein
MQATNQQGRDVVAALLANGANPNDKETTAKARGAEFMEILTKAGAKD